MLIRRKFRARIIVSFTGANGEGWLKNTLQLSSAITYKSPVSGLYDGENQLVAPLMPGQMYVPCALGIRPDSSGRPVASTPVAQFSFWTNGVALRNLPLLRSRR